MEYLGAFIIVLAVILLFYGMNKNSTVYEKFTSRSNKNDIKAGASTFYDWSGGMKTCNQKKVKKEDEEEYDNECDEKPVAEHKKCNCENCDITKMPGIDKYVLKSSVPPCPDMSNYAEKSMIKPDIDMSKYILKTDVKPCAKCPDMSKYVLKTEIPAKVQCPKCPTCPVCPICPDVNKHYKKGYNDAINHMKKKNSLEQNKDNKRKKEEDKKAKKEEEEKVKKEEEKKIKKSLTNQKEEEEEQMRRLKQFINEEEVKKQQKMLNNKYKKIKNEEHNITGYNPSLMYFHAQFEHKNSHLNNRNTVFGDRNNRVHNGLC